jgi:Tfp pilus assembly protein PilO
MVMNNSKLDYAYWYLSFYAKKIGAWGLIGLGIIILSLFFYTKETHKIDALIKETQATKDKFVAKDKLLANFNGKHDDIVESKPQTNLEEVNRFYRIFPKAVDLPQALATIYQVANKQRLALNSGDYKFNKVKDSNTSYEKKLTKYEIVLPIKGQYLQIQRFISDVLQKLPALALLDMQVRRENSMNQNVDARLVFVIFVKGES